MAHKQVLFRSAAREKILRGATQLADAVLGLETVSAAIGQGRRAAEAIEEAVPISAWQPPTEPAMEEFCLTRFPKMPAT